MIAREIRARFSGPVWAAEDRYWAINLAGDVASYLTVFDENFVGWPCAAERPSTKADLRALGGKLLEPRSLSVSLEDKASSGSGDSVVVFYRARTSQQASDGSIITLIRNFTHTWVKRPTGWRIIGGMCREDKFAK